MKKLQRAKYAVFIFLAFLWFLPPSVVFAQGSPTITGISLTPALDVSYFGSYALDATISGYPTSSPVSVEMIGINGNGVTPWQYYADGTAYSPTLTYDLTYKTGTTWEKTIIRPDAIYPQIFFAPSSITWNYSPSTLPVRRNDYSLLHIINPYTTTGDMNVWVEFNASAVSSVNSSDLQVYLVDKGKSSSFFTADWRDSASVELIGTVNRNTSVNHTHSVNSSHFLISLTANADKTIGNKHLDISSDFWIILYNTSPNTARGWNLRYHDASLCTNSNGWYRGNQTGWTIVQQSGCPDTHIHVARRTVGTADGVKATVTAGSASLIEEFSFGTLPNLKPNSTKFTNPVGGSYDGTINVTWDETTDPNGDDVVYSVYLLNSSGEVLSTLVSSTALTTYSWNTAGVSNGTYSLKGSVCDVVDPPLCADYYSEIFTVNHVGTINSLSTISISSSGSDPRTAKAKNVVSLTFTSTGSINTPSVAFYSGGNSVTNSVSVIPIGGNTWKASYVVHPSDTIGAVTFSITGSNLNLEYKDTTDRTAVVIETAEEEKASLSGDNPATTKTNSCTEVHPIGTPDLFQIDIEGTSANIYFAPIVANTSKYYVSFSEKQGELQHGADILQGPTTGVVFFRVNDLKPNTPYFFKVRGYVGCSAGNWSNELRVKTRSAGSGSRQSYYKNVISGIFSAVFPEVRVFPTIIKMDEQKISQETPPVVKNEQKVPGKSENPVKKRCFLWWCR